MTNGEMGILMDFGLDKRAASATLWTNIVLVLVLVLVLQVKKAQGACKA